MLMNEGKLLVDLLVGEKEFDLRMIEFSRDKSKAHLFFIRREMKELIRAKTQSDQRKKTEDNCL